MRISTGFTPLRQRLDTVAKSWTSIASQRIGAEVHKQCVSAADSQSHIVLTIRQIVG